MFRVFLVVLLATGTASKFGNSRRRKGLIYFLCGKYTKSRTTLPGTALHYPTLKAVPFHKYPKCFLTSLGIGDFRKDFLFLCTSIFLLIQIVLHNERRPMGTTGRGLLHPDGQTECTLDILFVQSSFY